MELSRPGIGTQQDYGILPSERVRAKLARVEEEKREAEQAQKYKDQARVGFGSQIRNYFLHPDQRVKDSRTGFSAGNFHNVLDGNIQPFLESYLRWRIKED